jgi:hypothetical protein
VCLSVCLSNQSCRLSLALFTVRRSRLCPNICPAMTERKERRPRERGFGRRVRVRPRSRQSHVTAFNRLQTADENERTPQIRRAGDSFAEQVAADIRLSPKQLKLWQAPLQAHGPLYTVQCFYKWPLSYFSPQTVPPSRPGRSHPRTFLARSSLRLLFIFVEYSCIVIAAKSRAGRHCRIPRLGLRWPLNLSASTAARIRSCKKTPGCGKC